MSRLSVYACRVTRHPSNVTTQHGNKVSVLVSVYGEVNPENPEQILVYEKPVLVDFLVGENSELMKKGLTKGTTLYVPASFITQEPIRRKDNTFLTTKDGTPIHRFVGMSIGDTYIREQPSALNPTIKSVSESKIVAASATEGDKGLLSKLKGMFTKHA